MLTPGGTLGGRYRLDERIATGGMGDVWKAQDTVLGRTVAVKILQSALLEEPGFVERFRAEARVMATINHPGVVKVYDYGETQLDGGGKVAYLVMEYVEGEALSRTLSRVGRLTGERTMDLLAQAGAALQAAHDHGIVHRDVKPGNLLIKPDGTLVLTDFGIARSAMSGQLTTAGSILGTASYVSPEQASGSSAITPASDVYSLGVVGYQCLSGHRPFEGDNPVQVAMKHIRDTPPPLPADVPMGARQVVERAMAKDPVHRWASAAAMADASRSVAAGGPATGAMNTGAMSGTASLRPPDRTSVMPGAPMPVPIPTSPAGTGNYHRGAASIPSAPPAMGYDSGGYEPTGEQRKGRGLMIAGIILAVVLVLGGGGALVYALVGDKGNATGGTGATNSPKASASAQSNNNNNGIRLNEADYVCHSYDEVFTDLTNKGLRPSRQWVTSQSNTNCAPGQVVGLEYDTPLEQNDVVTVDVLASNNGNGNGNGNGNQMPSMKPGDGGNNGGGQTSPTPTPESPSPNPSVSGSPDATTMGSAGMSYLVRGAK